jgi:hypothetical protein
VRHYSNGTHATHAFVVFCSPFATSFALFKKQLELKKVLATHDGILLHSVQHAAGLVAGCCGAVLPWFQSMLCSNLQVFQCFGILIDPSAISNHRRLFQVDLPASNNCDGCNRNAIGSHSR